MNCGVWRASKETLQPRCYYDLPSHLKQCFLYCAVFPKDYEMENVELIGHWMAQGYIYGSKSQDTEMVGEEYFENLVMRSLFQDIVVGNIVEGTNGTKCKMHDMVHDFAQSLVKNECLSIEIDSDGGTIDLDDSTSDSCRHLSIRSKERNEIPDSFYNLKKLRTLIVSESVLDLQKIFIELTLLRSLVLRSCDIEEVPSSINRLIHLRELDLSHNDDLVELPNTLWDLYNLQILKLRVCTGLQSLKGVGRLINLRHLDNYLTFFQLPKEIVGLNSLRRLTCVNVDLSNEEAFSLKHLKNFNQLGGQLMISWLKRGDGDVEDAKEAKLADKKYITYFMVLFGKENTESRIQQDEELYEALNMPPNSECIRILGYMGLKTPASLGSLTFLKTAQLEHWENCEHLPNNLGKLPHLEVLEFWGFGSVKKVGAEFLEMDSVRIGPLFPKLKSLSFFSLHDWEKWDDLDVDGDMEMLIMPSLTTLQIWSCEKLKALPNFILKKTSLNLDIRACDSLQPSL